MVPAVSVDLECFLLGVRSCVRFKAVSTGREFPSRGRQPRQDPQGAQGGYLGTQLPLTVALWTTLPKERPAFAKSRCSPPFTSQFLSPTACEEGTRNVRTLPDTCAHTHMCVQSQSLTT